MIQLLLDHNAQVNDQTTDGRTALAIAVERGNHVAFELLVDVAGQKWDVVDGAGRTLLHLAVESGRPYAVARVLQHFTEANLDAQDAEGDTALHVAGRGQSQEIVRALMQAGCDPARMNNRRETVFAAAAPEQGDFINELLAVPAIAAAVKLQREKEAERQTEAEQQRLQDKRARMESLWREKNGTLQHRPLSDASRARLAKMTAQGGRLRQREIPGAKAADVRKPIEARPWGGSAETEHFQRKVRLGLRTVRRDILASIDELQQDVDLLRQEMRAETDDAAVESE
jgi:hypothetical protein